MQQPPKQSSRSLRIRGSRSDLAGATLPASPVYVSAAHRQTWPQLPDSKRPSPFRRALLLLCLYGFLLGCCFWLAFPLWFVAQPGSALAWVLMARFPWLARLFWTNVPWLVSAAGHVSWLDLRASAARATVNLLLITLGGAFVCFLLAVLVCRRALRGRVGCGQARWLLLVICVFAFLYGTFFVFLPGGFSQEVLLSTLYGRLTLVYHSNPYLARPDVLALDPVYRLLPAGAFTSPQIGPLWLDLAVPLTWLTGSQSASAVVGFRMEGLFFHLLNALLIWAILTKLKPEVRLTGTLFYAWNPVLLLLSVGEVHADVAVIFLLLLSALFLQRRALLVSWICLLLGALINPLCLLLGPFFLRALARETRELTNGRRVLWWLGMLGCSLMVVALAYAPYWPGMGVSGIMAQVRLAFWQDTARHSLLATLKHLPFATWPPAAWLQLPQHWLLLPALSIGVLLLLGIWIADNLELSLLFGSWIFLVLAVLMPVSTPWLILIPFSLALACSSRRTSLLAHLLAAGSLLAYILLLVNDQWSGQALITIGLPVLIWGWTLFFVSIWEMAHREAEEAEATPQVRKRLSISISRPSWPSRPAAWPTRPGVGER